jgi:predicted SAM-dependent methyltransferase
MRLNLGCGNDIKEGFINIDTYNNMKGIDLNADIMNLPFKDETIDEVYISHVMEHFSFDNVMMVFKEINRVLMIGGDLKIYVPDFQTCVNDWNESDDKWASLDRIFGSQTHPGNYHFCGYTLETLKKIVEDFNFNVVENVLRSNEVSNDIEIKCLAVKTDNIHTSNMNFIFNMDDGPRLTIRGESNYEFRVEFTDVETGAMVHSAILRANNWTTSNRNDFNKLNVKVKQFGKVLFDCYINNEGDL